MVIAQDISSIDDDDNFEEKPTPDSDSDLSINEYGIQNIEIENQEMVKYKEVLSVLKKTRWLAGWLGKVSSSFNIISVSMLSIS